MGRVAQESSSSTARVEQERGAGPWRFLRSMRLDARLTDPCRRPRAAREPARGERDADKQRARQPERRGQRRRRRAARRARARPRARATRSTGRRPSPRPAAPGARPSETRLWSAGCATARPTAARSSGSSSSATEGASGRPAKPSARRVAARHDERALGEARRERLHAAALDAAHHQRHRHQDEGDAARSEAEAIAHEVREERLELRHGDREGEVREHDAPHHRVAQRRESPGVARAAIVPLGLAQAGCARAAS